MVLEEKAEDHQHYYNKNSADCIKSNFNRATFRDLRQALAKIQSEGNMDACFRNFMLIHAVVNETCHSKPHILTSGWR